MNPRAVVFDLLRTLLDTEQLCLSGFDTIEQLTAALDLAVSPRAGGSPR